MTDLSAVVNASGLQVRRTSADFIAESLRNAIQSGALPDGAELNQATLASHFGVSRVPVREAMRELQAEGLIVSEAHRRAVVRGLSLARVLETFELRAVVEGHLVQKATPRMTKEALKALRALDREMRKLTDHAEWLRANAEFHRGLYEPAGDETGLEVVELLRKRGERYVRLWSGGSGMHRPREAGKEHAGILAQIEKGDAEGSRRALEQHILSTRARLAAYGAEHSIG